MDARVRGLEGDLTLLKLSLSDISSNVANNKKELKAVKAQVSSDFAKVQREFAAVKKIGDTNTELLTHVMALSQR